MTMMFRTTALGALLVSAPVQAKTGFPQTLERHMHAVATRDLPALERTLTSGTQLELYLPNGKKLASRAEFVAFHRSWFAEKGWTMRFTPVSTFVGRDLAIATVRTRYEDQVDGKPYWSESWLTLTFRKESRGWGLVHDQNTRIATSADSAP
jgi:ketosteroid isomerase-like protein